MQVNPLSTGGGTDLRIPEGKEQARLPEKVAAPQEPSVPVAEKPAVAPSALPEPARVSVSIDETRELVYRFVDAKTGEVLSQTPPEEILKVVRGIQDLLSAEEHHRAPGVNVRG